MVAPKNPTEPSRLLNYLTAPHVLVWSAAVASSALPGAFPTQPLLVREPDGSIKREGSSTCEFGAREPAEYIDGSTEADLPMAQLSELFNINHFIVSQVSTERRVLEVEPSRSPRLPSLKAAAASPPPPSQANSHAWMLGTPFKVGAWTPPLPGAVASCNEFLKCSVRGWTNNMVAIIAARSKWTKSAYSRGAVNIATQNYEGREFDITINPWAGHKNAFTCVPPFFLLFCRRRCAARSRRAPLPTTLTPPPAPPCA